MALVETHYIIHEEDFSFRVRSNPDGESMNGADGVIIEYRDSGKDKWDQYFFISPNSAVQVAECILKIMGAKNV